MVLSFQIFMQITVFSPLVLPKSPCKPPHEAYSVSCSGPATGNLSKDHVNVLKMELYHSNASIFMLEYGCRLE